MENKKYSVGVAVITHNAKHHLNRCLPPLLQSPLKPRVLVVNSSSADGTVELALEMGAVTLVVPRSSFNHGTTREEARKYLGTDIVVMMTPDAYAVDEHVLEALIAPIVDQRAKAAYGRQIPHDGANIFEAFAREFNYPSASHVRGLQDAEKYGPYIFFCSNSFAAYCNHTLDEIGGFDSVLLGEDTIAVSKMLRKGYQVAYAAEAVVQHSHRYTLKQEFKRHFDTGYARSLNRHLISEGGKDSRRGKEYVLALFKQLATSKPWLIPYAAAQSGAKWLGYNIGSRSIHAPLWWKRACSSQDFFWTE